MTGQRFRDCPQCASGELRLRLGYAALPPREDTAVTELADGWKSASLQVERYLIMFCSNAPDGCTLRETAAIGLDADGNQVAAVEGMQVAQVLTEPDPIVLSDEQVRAALEENR